MRHIFISDLHIGSKLCLVNEINAFLDQLLPDDNLYILGDILETINFRKYQPEHWKLLERLVELNPVVVVGNHDMRSAESRFLMTQLFGEAPDSLSSLAMGGNKYRLCHGHAFDPTLNWQLMTDVAVYSYELSHQLHKGLGKWLKKKAKTAGGLMQKVINGAVSVARESNLNGIIMGHTHEADSRMVDGLHYLNCGSWTLDNAIPTYIISNGGLPELRYFKGAIE